MSSSHMWYPESPCGSSTKCLRTVTLQSSCKRHWVHTSCNLMQTQSWREGMCLRATCGMDSHSPCHSLQLERFATADCFVALPFNWANFKRNKKTVPWRDDSVNPLTAEPILQKREEVYSAPLLVRGGWLCYLGRKMKGSCPHLSLYFALPCPSLNPLLAVWAFVWFRARAAYADKCLKNTHWLTHTLPVGVWLVGYRRYCLLPSRIRWFFPHNRENAEPAVHGIGVF